jgi:hypothetical protein
MLLEASMLMNTWSKVLLPKCMVFWLVFMVGGGPGLYAPGHAQADATAGAWSSVGINFPYRFIQAVLLPTGGVMFWDSYTKADNARIWWPNVLGSGAVTAVAKANYNIFCSGFTLLPDGQLFVPGGHVADDEGLEYAYTYNPFTNAWARQADMNAGRWYPTPTTLANGDVLVVSGMIDTVRGMNPLPQIWEAATGTWRSLTNAQLQLPYYPYMFLMGNGKVFNAGPNKTTRYLDTAGTGTWTVVGDSQYGARNWGTSVMYDDGKVLLAGGSKAAPYDRACPVAPTATAEVIDLNAASPAWRSVGEMAFPRKQHNATLLPDGTVLVTGGTSGACGNDDTTSPVYAAEVWDPATDNWTTLAANTVYRGYHAIALLLPDGRVLSAGGNYTKTAEVFSPPYLFKGTRPTITAAPCNVGFGQTFTVTTPDPASITRVTWVRLSAVTHTFNFDQRFIQLPFSPGTGGLQVTAPADAHRAPPGHYMLFLLNGNGVPSVAKIIRLEAVATPLPAPPSNLTATAVSNSQITLAWTDNATIESGFKIESSPNKTSWHQIATVSANSTSYTHTGLLSDRVYHYRVRAYNAACNSAYSNTGSARTLP